MSVNYPTAPLTFIAEIKTVQGEYEHYYPCLLAASSLEAAQELAQSVIEREYPDSDVDEDTGSVLACAGELLLSVRNVQEISLPTFLEMASAYNLHKHCERGYMVPVSLESAQSLKTIATAVTKSLKAAGVEVAQGQILNALASAVGERNWQQYRARVVPVPLLQHLIVQANEVNSLADTTGCDDGYTVTYQPAIDALIETAKQVQELIDKASAKK